MKETLDLEYEQACRQATCQIAQAVEATSAQMYDWDPATGRVSVVAEYHGPHATPHEHRDELGVTHDLGEFPTTLHHLADGRAYVVHAHSADADLADLAWLAAVSGKTALKVPMMAHGAVIGFVELCDSRRPREWTAEEMRLCETLAGHAAVTIENARLQKNQRRQAALLTLLHTVTRRTRQVHDPDALIRIVVETIAEQFEYTIVDVVMLDASGRELILHSVAGTNAAFTPTHYRQSIEQGILGLVVRTGRSYMSNNVRQDPNYLGWRGWPRGSELAVPIQRAGQTIGALNLESQDLGAFSAADLTAMEILTGQLAAGLDSAHFYAQTHRRLNELAVLHEIAQASATAGDVDTLLECATQIIAANLDSDNAGFFVLDEVTGLLRPHRSYHGVPSEALQASLRLGQGITGQVAATGQADLATDVRTVRYYIPVADDIRSEMAAPLWVGGRMFGVLNVESRQLAAYSQEDLRWLTTITDQLSAAVERAQAQERATRMAARLSVINELGRAAVTLDAIRLLSETAEALHQRLKYDYVLTALVNPAAATFQPIGCAGGRPFYLPGQTIPLSHPHDLLADVATRGEPAYVPDTSCDPRCTAGPAELRSELCVPIGLPGEAVLGLVNLKSRRLAAFDADDIEALKLLAGQLANALINARLYEDAQRRLRELSGLYELSQVFNLIGDSGQVYGQITELVAGLLGVEQCGIVLHDPTSGLMVMQAPAYGLSPDQVARYRWPLSLEHPPAWRRGEVLISNDPVQDAQTIPELGRSLAIELGERSLLVVPLVAGERCLGFVRVANKIDGSPFTAYDARLLGIFAGQAAGVIENARLLADSRRRAERLEALQRAGAVLAASLDMRSLLEALYRELPPLFNAEALALYTLAADGRQVHGEGMDRGVYRSLVVGLDSASLGAYVIRTGQPLLIADLARERAALPVGGVTIGDPARSWLGVPLFVRGQAGGALTIQSYAPDRFGQEDLWLLSQAAAQVMLTIQNVHSYQQAQRQVSELTTLSRVSLQLGSLLDPNEVMYAVVEGAQALVGASDVRLFHYDATRDQWRLAAARSQHRHATWPDALPRPHGLAAQVADRGQPIVVNAPAQHPLYANAGESALSAVAGIPIKRAERILAVLNVAFLDQPHQFTDDQVRLLTMLADQAALALDNAALFESERRQRVVAETLREMAAIVSASLDLDQVLDRMLDQIRRVVEYDQASVGLIADGRLVIRAMAGFAETDHLVKEMPIDKLPLARQVIATARPVWLADLQDPSAFPHEILNSIGARQVRASVGIPIVSRGEVIGIVYLDSFEPNAFTLEHACQVQAFTNQAAIAIVNARLYQVLADRPTPLDRQSSVSTASCTQAGPVVN